MGLKSWVKVGIFYTFINSNFVICIDSFDDISDKDIEDNIETAENTIQTNIDRGMLNKNRRVNMKAKTKTTIIFILSLILIPIVILFGLFCFLLSFCMLNAQVNDWVRCNNELLDDIPLEKTYVIADSEAWQVIYKFPLVPYVRVQATYVDDGSMTEEELKAAIEEIAKKSDEKFGGNKSKVIIERGKNSENPRFYVQIRKRCRSWYSIFHYPSLPFLKQ